ncbi:MAG: 4Fe-4S dicluster domain-containing protein [Anaerolineales bacterium]|nr:MAG: 4Fe-4S dicluster domain-containing protein [Anaerolineales bacterium]
MLIIMDDPFQRDPKRHQTLVSAYVVPESIRCVQCGICSYNCPLGIDVRLHAWKAEPVTQSECITCGECVRRCPRGVLRFQSSDLFRHLDSK